MVLAQKYRPKRFEDIVGQEAIIKTLTNAIDKNRIANAYLFSGLRGSGKTTTARVFAKSLQCKNGPTSSPCEECENCLMANQNRHIDIIEIDAASNRKIDDIRELIEQTRYKPSVGRFKIFIIDEVHMLTNEAFNAFLKTLEEPPEYVKFILATTDPLKLPSTILSRVQHFRFNKIPEDIIKNYLMNILSKENINYEIDALRILAKFSRGSLRDALTITDQAIAFSNFNINIDSVTEMLGVVNPDKISEIFKAIFEKDRYKVKEIVAEIKDYDIESIIDEVIIYLKEKLFNNSFDLVIIHRFFNIISQTQEIIKYSSDNEFILSLMFFRMIEATKTFKIDDLIKNYEIKEDDNIEKFKAFVNKVKNSYLDLGICIETSVKFIDFKNNVLVWESCPDQDCKLLLKREFSAYIRPILNEIFGNGNEIKIEVIRCKNNLKEEIKNNVDKKKEIEIDNSSLLIQKVREIFGTTVKIRKINF